MADQHDNIGVNALMVEGPDDCHLVEQILLRSDLKIALETSAYGGYQQLIERIEGELRVTNRAALGIVVDANNHPDRRWQSVKSRLDAHGAVTPESLGTDGIIIRETDELPRVGVWMMPDNESPGELEHFVAKMIPPGDPVWPRSQRYVDCIPVDARAFRPQDAMGAKVLSWIATRRKPGFMGQAISRGDLRTDGELCQRFIAWLDRLFADEGDVVDAK